MHSDYGYFEESQLGKPYDMKLLKRLYPYTRPYRRLLFWSIGLVLLITALDLALPIVTKVAIDRYIVPQISGDASEKKSEPDEKTRRLTVNLNGETVIEDAQLPGIPARGPLALQHHGDPIEFANIFVKELD